MKKLTVFPLIALISMNAEAIKNEAFCEVKNQDLFQNNGNEVNEDIIDSEIDRVNEILTNCTNIETRYLTDEEILEILRNTGWTWQ